MAGIYIPWLSDAARLTGFPVVEVAGWRTRGHGGYRVVEGIIAHHTGGPATGEYPSLGVVRDGRADLAGPLSAYGIGRSGAIYVIAAGVSWHAGASRWAGFTDLNDEFLGIEAESSGGGAWTAAQREVYPRLCAAALYYMNRDASRIGAHREVALPAGRKPDPTGIDMPALRSQVANMLVDPLRRIPRTALEDDMPTAREIADAILDTPITRQGELLPVQAKGATTSLRNEVAYMTNESYRVAQIADSVLFGKAGVRSAGQMALAVDGLRQRLDALLARPAGGQVDPAPIVDAIVRAGIADQVVDALVDRLAS